jgi:N-succinyldiaminopimelate aminotransferase
MNHLLSKIGSYPFEKLNLLLKDIKPSKDVINLSIGEPKLNADSKVLDILNKETNSFSNYPPMNAVPELSDAYRQYLKSHFGIKNVAEDEVCLVAGTREGTFSIIQALFNKENVKDKPYVVMPNPFYQIYGGATTLAGGEAKFLDCPEEDNFQPDLDSLKSEDWQMCQILVLCSPNNPTGSVLPLSKLKDILDLAVKYDFYVVSDECYVDLYTSEESCPSILQASSDRSDRLVALHSLSKRSNLPGFRSGFACSSKRTISAYKKFRSFHGVSVPLPIQKASVEAWLNYDFVAENRKSYNDKFSLASDMLKDKVSNVIPEGAFYLWLDVRDGQSFSKKILEKEGLIVLPGSYLSTEVNGFNPGEKYVRIALVYDFETTEEALKRISNLL